MATITTLMYIERPREFDSKGWLALKTKIYAIIIALVFLVSSFNKERWLRFVCEIGCGLAISNFLDKCFYDVIDFYKIRHLYDFNNSCFMQYHDNLF